MIVRVAMLTEVHAESWGPDDKRNTQLIWMIGGGEYAAHKKGHRDQNATRRERRGVKRAWEAWRDGWGKSKLSKQECRMEGGGGCRGD